VIDRAEAKGRARVVILSEEPSDRGACIWVKHGEYVVDATALHKSLIRWGRKNFRPFPWRATNDPYQLLMAEVMLHRTQARQAERVYSRFIEDYPDLRALSRASAEELRKALYSLGLPERIEHFIRMVDELLTRFDGKVPRQKTDLLSLTGVSEYIGSAVRCFAWNEPEPLIDTNTVRVIGRIFMLEIKDSSRRNPLFRKLIAALVDYKQPRAYNYALLDLADQICTKKKPPDCRRCPIRRWCGYGTLALSMPDRLEVRRT
jgi:A/G-specific adenine glycosylase